MVDMEKPNHPLFKDRTGHTYNFLTVIEYAGKLGAAHAWLVRCQLCGTEKPMRGGDLGRPDLKSCGCYRDSMTRTRSATHGMSGTPTHRSWKAMLTRALNPNIPGAANYSGRGIGVCDAWLKFENFLFDMGERPLGMTLDRVDNNQGYSPGNCRWATPSEQANNTRNCVLLTLNGITLNIKQWARHLGVPPDRLYGRIRRGWPPERALTPDTERQKRQIRNNEEVVTLK